MIKLSIFCEIWDIVTKIHFSMVKYVTLQNRCLTRIRFFLLKKYCDLSIKKKSFDLYDLGKLCEISDVPKKKKLFCVKSDNIAGWPSKE